MEQRTPAQRIKDFCADYGLPKVLLRANETFVSGSCKDDMAVIVIARLTVEEHSTYRLVTGASTRMQVMRWMGDRWLVSPNESMVIADPDFKPVRIAKYGVRSVTEYIESRDWARDCHRPGTANYPLDSYYRLTMDPAPTDPMSSKYYR